LVSAVLIDGIPDEMSANLHGGGTEATSSVPPACWLCPTVTFGIISFNFVYERTLLLSDSYHIISLLKIKVKLLLQQAVKAHKVVRRRGSHII
jgi:hypothetical protein